VTEATIDWQPWFAGHGRALVLLARQWTRCQADAEDVVHDAFVRFWRRREGVRDPTGYLYACVRTVAIDHLRRRRDQVDLGETSEPWFEASESGAEANERLDSLQQAIDSLPLEQRQVVIMKVWGGLTFASIAEAAAISPNTAASRYRYAVESLRSRLDSTNIA